MNHDEHGHDHHEARYTEGDAAAWERPLRDSELFFPERQDMFNFIDETKVRHLRPLLPPAGRALEVGAGSGRLLIRLGRERGYALTALDYAPYNIRVNAVCPGCILTSASYREIERLGISFEEWRDSVAPGHMLGRLGEPVEVANAALFLASDEASFITATHLLVDGGYVNW